MLFVIIQPTNLEKDFEQIEVFNKNPPPMTPIFKTNSNLIPKTSNAMHFNYFTTKYRQFAARIIPAAKFVNKKLFA